MRYLTELEARLARTAWSSAFALAVICAASPQHSCGAEPSRIRVATYNIQFLNMAAAQTGNRIEKLRKIIADIGADAIALQEIADRKAAEMILPPSEWQIVIDDESPDEQDLAIAVRKSWRLVGIDASLDADDGNFLAPGASAESFFPNRRDALTVGIASPDGKTTVHVICVHQKSRRDGRSKTDARREGGARLLAEAVRARFAGKPTIIMGDFNDTPDDLSLNILETGDPNTTAGPEETDGALFVNLCEPLIAQDLATEGCKPEYIEKQTGWINVRVPGSRNRNNEQRGSDRFSGPALFDQILISPNLKSAWIPGSTQIYRKPVALEGPGFTRPSDHLPVYADFDLSKFR